MVSTSQAGMTRFVGKTPVMFVLASVLGLAGCVGNRPWVQSARSLEAPNAISVMETDARAVHIIIQPTDPSAPPPEVIIQEAPPTNDGWKPDAFPAANPFERHRTWVGDYDCRQGNTGFALRIMDVRGRVIRAIFDFMHEPSGANGSYIMMGHFDPETRRVHFEPSSWILQPADYVMVPMSGEISTDDTLFAGKIDFPSCGAFKLKPTR
jgi:hypothetical protein